MQNVPKSNLAYPIFVQLENRSTGSGFNLIVKKKIYFITARHVIYDDSFHLRSKKLTLSCQSEEDEDETTTNYLIDLEKCIVKCHEKADIAVVEIGNRVANSDGITYTISPSTGVTKTQVCETNSISVNAEQATKRLKDVLISNDVFVYGYPTSLGLKTSPQFDYTKPLLRKGIVAQVYPKHGTIIIDCPVYFGNSGGPVVEVEEVKLGRFNHSVIGVVSQFIPYIQKWHNPASGIINEEHHNSGYAVVVSMDKVFELIDNLSSNIPSKN